MRFIQKHTRLWLVRAAFLDSTLMEAYKGATSLNGHAGTVLRQPLGAQAGAMHPLASSIVFTPPTLARTQARGCDLCDLSRVGAGA